MSTPLTAERLRALLRYDPETGAFTWRVDRGRRFRAGMKAGCARKDGRCVLRIAGKLYLGSRLAWLWMTGEWPPRQVDHEDLDCANDRWANLRLATNAQNMRNTRAHADSQSGRKGVHLDRRTGRWVASIMADGISHYLGSSFDIDEAAAMYEQGAQRLHGEFARTA